MKQKLLYLVCVLLGLHMPLAAQFSDGSGTADDPYQITTAKQLADLNNYLDADGNGKYFRLMNDIDLADLIGTSNAPAPGYSNGWTPVGTNQADFTGSFDGGGFTIKGLWINLPSTNHVGLFGFVSHKGSIKDLAIEVTAGGITGQSRVGALVGYLDGGSVSGCSATGGKVTGNDIVGGLVGVQMGALTGSYATVEVEGNDVIGGLVGSYYTNEGYVTTIDGCFATGQVTATGSGARIGGLVGYQNGTITNCYATGSVTATQPSSFAGGLIGVIHEDFVNDITSCYYLQDEDTDKDLRGVGGYYDENEDTDYPYGNDSYPPALTTNAAPLTASEMASETSYTGWDFTDTWHFIESHPYPVLQVFGDFTSGNGSETDPYQISNASQLNNVRNHLDKHFILANDIDLTQWIDNHPVQDIKENGWMPVGEYIGWDETTFQGSFDGQGFRITGLWIDRQTTNNVGLFGALGPNGTLENVKVFLAAQDVIGKDYVGGLVGRNQGKVTGCAVEGDERGEGVEGNNSVGGLTGINWAGSIISSYATVSVKAQADGASVGGLTGDNIRGHITSCYATGAVTATAAGAYNLIASVGGLTGYNGGSITSSYATGPVTAHGDYTEVGGLTGYNENSITSSYATGPVTAHGDYARVGGLTGDNNVSIITSYATGTVTAHGDNALVGGLTGFNNGSIITSYATGSVTATGQNAIAGGLIGVIYEDVVNDIISCYYLQDEDPNKDLRGVGGYYDKDLKGYYPYADNLYPPTLTDNVTSLSPAGMQTKSSFNPAHWQFITNSKYADPDKGAIWMLPAGAPSPYLWWECEPLDDTAIYHTITLVVDSGIQLYNFSPGPLVVEDGGHLYLQFLPESPGLTAADLVLTIDDVETAFKNFGDNRYYTYILNPVDKDYEIHIALRDNTVGNAVVATGNVSVVVESGQLKVESAHPVDVAVYTISGQAIAFVRGMSGTKMFDLPSGVYIVRAGNTTEKIVIND